jgi:hypothetical protein
MKAIRRLGAAWLALAACGVATVGCFHQTTAWPLALDPGSAVEVTFAQPRAVGVGNDSVLVMTGLKGHVQALRSDTLIVNLTSVSGDVARSAWVGHVSAFALDSSTKVVHSEFERGSVPLVIIAGLVGFYAFIGSLPP